MFVVFRLAEKFRVHSQEARAEALDSLTTSFLSSRLHGSYEQARNLSSLSSTVTPVCTD